MDPIIVDGITFPAVLEPAGRGHKGKILMRQVTANGRPLYALPGGLMAPVDILPAIAARMNPVAITPGKGKQSP